MFKFVTVGLSVGALSIAVAGCSDDDGDSPEVSAFCNEAEEMQTEYSGAMPVLDGMKINAEWLQAVQAITPAPEIADDWEVLLTDYAAYDEAVVDLDLEAIEAEMEGLDPNSNEAPEGLEEAMTQSGEAMQILQAPEHTEASTAVSAFINEECASG